MGTVTLPKGVEEEEGRMAQISGTDSEAAAVYKTNPANTKQADTVHH